MHTSPPATIALQQEWENCRQLAADQLALFAGEVKSMCESGDKPPREILIIGGLMFDAWEHWEAVSTGKRSGVAALIQLVDRIARKSKSTAVSERGQSLNASLAKLNQRGL